MAWLSLLLLACTGCQLGLEVDLVLDRNGGGTLAVVVSADAELQQRAEQADVDPLANLVAAGEELRADGWSVSDTTGDDGTRRVVLSAPFADPDAFNALARDVAEAVNADEAVLLEQLQLAVTDDALRLTGTAAAEPTRAVRDYGLTPGRVVRLVEREDAFAYRIAVTVPGEVVSTNGEIGAGNRVAWDVPPGGRVDLAVESTRPGLPILRAAGGALIGGLVAGAVLWLVLRRRQPSARSARIRSFSART